MADGRHGDNGHFGPDGRFDPAAPIDDADLGRLILDSAVDYAIVTMSPEGHVTSWNEGAERILGWSEAEIIGQSSRAFFTPEDVAQGRMEAEMREAAETGRATDERYHMRRDGSRFYAQGLMMPLRGSDTRSRSGFLKIFRDQTKRHEAELRVRYLENSVATVLRTSGTIGLYRFDPGRRIVWGDESCARMFDLDPILLQEGADAAAFFDRIHPDDVARVEEAQRRTTRARDHLDVTFRVVHADGGIRWLHTLSDLAALNGDATGTVGEEGPEDDAQVRSGVMIDVTERRREERMHTAILEVGDRLRTLDDPAAMARVAFAEVGRVLDLSRAGHGEVDPDGEIMTVRVDWTARGAASLLNKTLRFDDHGLLSELLQRGETVVLNDVRDDPRVTEPGPLERIGLRALVQVPLMERGRLTTVFFLGDDRPRSWTQGELDFIRAVFDRTYAAIERVRAVEERELMNRELAHRMKNVLTIAQVIATQSLRYATTLEAGRAQVAARLTALARAQDMLTDGSTSNADIRDVILKAMTPHLDKPDRLTLDGPSVMLTEQQMLGLSLGIHELATNAAKYGALAVPEGRIVVHWSCAAAQAFRLTWREEGGSAPEPNVGTGFGSTILDRIVGEYFGGRSELRLEPTGAVFTIEGQLGAGSGAPKT